MNLKSIILGFGILGAGGGFSYAVWDNFPRNTKYEELARPLLTFATGLAGAIAGGRLIGNGIRDQNNPRNQSTPSNPNSQNFPRKRKYVERRIDEYGREYRIEREETIE